MISIVMPVRNCEAYLADAISTVLRQSYTDWELIVVNDASTDSTQKLIDYFVEKDVRIKTIYLKESKGIAHARNEGIKASKGEYIAVMDADDMMLPNRLKLSLKAIKDVDFTYGAYYITDSHGAEPKGLFRTSSKIVFDNIRSNNAWPHVTIMAKRECFIETPYREDFKVNDDGALVWDWFKKGYKYRPVRKEPLMVVRRFIKSTSDRKKDIAETQGILNEEYKSVRL